jgi:colanic acid/amylovoran biosynthesis glycosyltransferase
MTSASKEKQVRGARRLGVIVSRFPKLTETFVLHEILELQRLGVEVELFPLLRHRESIVQSEVERLVAAAHYRPLASVRLWRDNGYYLVSRPRRYVGAFLRVVRGSWRSPRYLAGAVVFFPKAASFARIADRSGVQHVHAHFANHPAVAAMVMHALTGIPYSFTARGSDIHVDRTMLPEKVAAAQFAIAVSAFNKEVMVRACGAAAAEKIHVVYGGVDTRLFAPAPAHADGGAFRIVCIGRFEEVKGHAQLIEACGILDRRGISFTCHLLGDGELRAALESQIARLGLCDRMVLHGNQPQTVIRDALRAASVCVLATVQAANGKREGIPNVLKEAMACGVPVVSSRISGIPELVEDGLSGLLVPPRDPAALAEALMALATDEGLRERLGRAGRARIERDFDLRTSTRRRADLFFPGCEASTDIGSEGSGAGRRPVAHLRPGVGAAADAVPDDVAQFARASVH